MRIKVKLFGSFCQGRFTCETRDCLPGATILDVVRDLGLSEHELGITLVDRRRVGLEHLLADGETLVLFPSQGGA